MTKRLFSMAGLLGCMALLLICSEQAAQAVRTALTLCVQSVIPALFPFFVLSSLFVSLGYAELIGGAFSPLTRRLFRCSDAGAAAFFLGLIGGYPVGGRAVGALYRSGRCTAAEAEHLLSFCNNAGPAFILGVVGAGCFHDPRCGVWLWGIHVLAAVLVGCLPHRINPDAHPSLASPRADFPSAFVQAVGDGALAMLQLCGFVAFFLVILQLLTSLTGISHPLIIGAIELTGGILRLPPTRQGFVYAAALLGWGGLSVHCQTAAVLGGTGLSMRRCLAGKLVQAILSAILAIPVSMLLFP
ncbi:MAG: sporulation protein [Clostridiales bacterium]|nr:sporulation protein [Candidatus Cacconaster stercorequi]